jgi:hypothetical protein
MAEAAAANAPFGIVYEALPDLGEVDIGHIANGAGNYVNGQELIIVLVNGQQNPYPRHMFMEFIAQHGELIDPASLDAIQLPDLRRGIAINVQPPPPIPAHHHHFHNHNNNAPLGIVYEALPDLGALPMEDAVASEVVQFVNGEELLVITQEGNQYKFKRNSGILEWLAHNMTNPVTGLPVQLDQLSRATAMIITGGRRRQTKKRSGSKRRRRSTRRLRSTRSMRSKSRR